MEGACRVHDKVRAGIFDGLDDSVLLFDIAWNEGAVRNGRPTALGLFCCTRIPGRQYHLIKVPATDQRFSGGGANTTGACGWMDFVCVEGKARNEGMS